MAHSVADELKSLHTAAIDARNGYEEALQDAEGKGMTPLFHEMIAVHTKNANALSGELQRAGEQADDKGSFMSAVHRTVMSVRSMFGGLDESVIPGLIDGEKRNVSHYDDAIEMTDLPPSARAVVVNNCDRLQDAIRKMELIKA